MNTEENAKKVKKKRSLKLRLIIWIVVFVLAAAELLRANLVIYTENFDFESSSLPSAFDGCVIVQVSDFHNRSESYAKRLCEKVGELEPDYIFITGDTVDRFRTNIDNAEFFLKEISQVGQCFLIWGNHEQAVSADVRDQLRNCCEKYGITVLEDDVVYIERGSERIAVAGAEGSVENAFLSEDMFEEYSGEFTIWLHHYPEDAEKIAELSEKNGVRADMIFSGHAHGGLVGLPLADFGLYAPGQGFFPKYVSGDYSVGGCELYVSRGVGNSGYTKRFGSSCEILVCTLHRS